MELRQLKYFITIANMKSFSDAAKSLFVTQPTLSWNIQKLEEKLGHQLFFQSNEGLKLTEAGELLYNKGKEVLDMVSEVENEIQLLGVEESKTLKVGLTVLFAIQYMEEIVRFTSINSNVELTFVQRGSIELQRKLANKEIDIGLLSFPIYEPSISIESLNTSNPYYSASVVMPFDHPLADRESIKIPDLKGHSVCLFSQNYVLGRVIRERCQDHGFQPNIVFVNDNWEVLLQNTLLANGITFMPHSLEQISNFHNLVWIPLDDKANHFPIGIARRKGEQLSDVEMKFIDHIKEN